jgi:hypothetical protein
VSSQYIAGHQRQISYPVTRHCAGWADRVPLASPRAVSADAHLNRACLPLLRCRAQKTSRCRLGPHRLLRVTQRSAHPNARPIPHGQYGERCLRESPGRLLGGLFALPLRCRQNRHPLVVQPSSHNVHTMLDHWLHVVIKVAHCTESCRHQLQ